MDICIPSDERPVGERSKLDVDVDPVVGKDTFMLDHVGVDSQVDAGVKSTVIVGIGRASGESLIVIVLSSLLSSPITML